MTTIAEVRNELALVLGNISGWSTSAYIGDQVRPFMFKIARPAFDPRMVMQQTKAAHTFTVTAYAPRATPEASEAALDALCELSGDGSLIATVQNGELWETAVDYAQVIRCGEVQAVTWIDSVDYLVCQFEIEVVW